MAYTALMTKDEIGFENNTNTITTLEIAEMMELEHWQILRKLEGTKTKMEAQNRLELYRY